LENKYLKMNILRWRSDCTLRPSLTCIPPEIIRDIVVGFLSEKDAFNARGICWLFASAYFGHGYKDSNSTRVLAMLSHGYQYQKLNAIKLEFNMLDNLSPLAGLPALEKVVYRNPSNLDIDTIPTNLRKLVLTGYQSHDVTGLYRCAGLQELDLSCSQIIDVQTIPSALVCLRKLTLEHCDLRDLSTLERFPILEELVLSHNNNLQLTTLPGNLKLLKLNVKNCDLSNLSHLNRLPSLEELDLSLNYCLELDTIPYSLRHLRKLCMKYCNLASLMSLNRFPSLKELVV